MRHKKAVQRNNSCANYSRSDNTLEGNMGNHVAGEMDITEHKKTFDAFIKVGVRLGVFCTVALIFLAIVGH